MTTPTKLSIFPSILSFFFFYGVVTAEDQVVASSDYDSTHDANHSDSSDVAHTEEDAEEGKPPGQNVILHALIPPEVRQLHRHATPPPRVALTLHLNI